MWLGKKFKKILIQNFDFINVSVQPYHNIQKPYNNYDYIVFINTLPSLEDSKAFNITYMGENWIDLKKFKFLATMKFIYFYINISLIFEEIVIYLE